MMNIKKHGHALVPVVVPFWSHTHPWISETMNTGVAFLKTGEISGLLQQG